MGELFGTAGVKTFQAVLIIPMYTFICWLSDSGNTLIMSLTNDSAQLHQSQLWKHWYSYSLFCLVCTVCICCFFLFCFFPRVLFCLLIWTLRLIVTYTDFCSRCTLLLMCAGISAWTPLAQSWTTGQRCVWRTALSDSSTPLWPSPTASHRWCRKELICNGLYVLQQELMDWMFHSMPVENVKIFVLNVVLCSKPVTYCC